MRFQGRITTWKDDQGFGFITPNGGGNQVFVHIKSFANHRRRPEGSEIVTYELITDANGRAQAQSVAFVGDRLPSAPTGYSRAPLILALVFLCVVAGAAATQKLPAAVFALYLGASAVTFIAYAVDKSASRKDQWRISEFALHLLALIGGWPGALAAQRLLRHKTRKQPFQIVFWVTAVMNCGALGWLFTFFGAPIFRSLITRF